MDNSAPIIFEHNTIALSQKELREFCTRWKISELSLFGSILREDFGPDSDMDFLVSFAPDSDWTLLDHIQMEEELSALLNRPVDLVSRRAVENSRNPIRRRAILSTAQVIYAT